MGSAAGLTLWPRSCLVCQASLQVASATGICAACLGLLPDHGGPSCPRCGLEMAWGDGQDSCQACRLTPPPWQGLVAPYAYTGPVRALIGACKFGGRDDVGAALGALLAEAPAARALAAGCQGVVPVPMPSWRRRRRGFNLATLLARPLARACGLPMERALKRRREGRPQSRLAGDARRANVAGTFVARAPLGGTWLLVDDVVTSGHTVRAASLALLAAGAGQVRVAALARTQLWDVRERGNLR